MGGLSVRRGIAHVAAVVVATALLLGSAPVVRAAEVSFEAPGATSSFGRGVGFTQTMVLPAPARRVELLLTFVNGLGPGIVEQPGSFPAGRRTLRYDLDLSAGGHIVPNTGITARWRIELDDADRTISIGPPVTIRYEDDRFAWRTASGDLVRVHWYDGSADFGRRALEIGERAVADTAAILGVTEDAPIDFFIYSDQDAFYDALGPGTRENVGGQANGEIRTLFARIAPSQIDDPWVGTVIPHELAHLVFDTAVENPYHFPPRWLNEGLAVHLSQGYERSDQSLVEAAARRGTLIPLDGLTAQFPTAREQFFLAYAESISAVDFLIRTHTRDALVALIRSYANGRTDDEAFMDAIGMDTTAFGVAWLADLDATAPVRFGPQPAPAGPVPSDWVGPGTTPLPDSGAIQASSVIAAAGLVIVFAAMVLGLRFRRRRAA